MTHTLVRVASWIGKPLISQFRKSGLIPLLSSYLQLLISFDQFELLNGVDSCMHSYTRHSLASITITPKFKATAATTVCPAHAYLRAVSMAFMHSSYRGTYVLIPICLSVLIWPTLFRFLSIHSTSTYVSTACFFKPSKYSRMLSSMHTCARAYPLSKLSLLLLLPLSLLFSYCFLSGVSLYLH